jgi:hypothetical protein
MSDERVVAVGFLTERDLSVLGSGFRRMVPITDDDAFAELLAKLDEVTGQREQQQA